MGEISLKNRYIIEGQLAKGGQSVIFTARDNHFQDRTVVVKLYNFGANGAPECYRIEKQILTTYNNSSIPKAHDFEDNVSGGKYGALMMDYIKGLTLADLYDRNELTGAIVMDCICKIASVLHYCHTHQDLPVVYADLKPENIIKSSDGNWRLVDFGSAIFLNRAGAGTSRGLGTRGFAPVELIEKRRVSPASDVYCLAALYYFLGNREHYTPEKYPTLGEVMKRALNPDLNYRFSRITDFVAELRNNEAREILTSITCKVCGHVYKNAEQCPKCLARPGESITRINVKWELPKTNYNIVPLVNTPLKKILDEKGYQPFGWKPLRDYAEKLSEVKGFEELISINRLNIELYPHQREAVFKFLNIFRGSGILADEVGLGKTIEAGMIISELRARGLARRVLIVTPNHLIEQWIEDMLEKIHLRFSIFDQDTFENNSFTIVPFGTFRISQKRSLLQANRFDVIVVDEAHNLITKSGLSTAWDTLNGMQRKYTILISATPIKRRITDLYHLTQLTRPGEFKTLEDFTRAYCYSDLQVRNVAQLKNILSKLVIRNKRRECAKSWPNKISHPRVVDRGKKFWTLLEILEKNRETLVIVFAVSNILQHELYRKAQEEVKDRKLFLLYGSRFAKNETVRRFRGSKNGVLFVDKTSSEGRNLQFCHIVINYDISTNPIEMEQRIGRVYRIGQDNDVHIYNLAEKESLEECLLEFYDQHLMLFSLWRGEIYEIIGDTDHNESVPVMAKELWDSSHSFQEFRTKWNKYIEDIIKVKQQEDQEEITRDQIMEILF